MTLLTVVRDIPDVDETTSKTRHPSAPSHVGEPCETCKFATVPHDAVVTAIEALHAQWNAAVLSGEARTLDAARMRDELHVAANRIDRITTNPNRSAPAFASIDAPSALMHSAHPSQVLAILHRSIDRLACSVAQLDESDLLREARVGIKKTSIAELLATVLHRSHARVTGHSSCL